MPSLMRPRKGVLLKARHGTLSFPLPTYRRIPLDVNQWVITTNRSDSIQWNMLRGGGTFQGDEVVVLQRNFFLRS